PPVESGKAWYPASVKCILQNEKYVGDSLMQKYYTANHLEHDSTPNRNLMVEQYYKEDTHPALVGRDVYEDANRIMMMRNCKRGASQYPYYGRLVCPYCGKPMVKVNTRHGKIPGCWVCGGENKGELYGERTDCPVYWVKEPYLSNAVCAAIMSLKTETLETAYAMDVAWVQSRLASSPSLEFGHLKRLIEHITFDGWDTLQVMWIWGKETRAPYAVERASDYPEPYARVAEGKQSIGPFCVSDYQRREVEQAAALTKQQILKTRIIADHSHRFSCPPLVV
ncbi:MAG: recombinase family protein, partial [Gemmiger sp.]